ncbi:MAG: glycosyltransferase family 2 protein [Muribaculaceae bacterium]
MNTDKRKKISVLIPFYNEEEVLPQLYERLAAVMDSMPEYDWEAMLVNDGSKDRSLVAAARMHEQDKRFHYIDLSRNFGKETAMMAGFDHVTGDCVVIMDSDLQHPPEVIPDMVAEWEKGYDDIYGQRLTRGKEPWLRKVLSLTYYKLLQKSTNIPILENTGDFRLLDRMCINALKSMRESNRYTKGMYCYVGFRKKGVPFKQEERAAGTTKWNFFKLFNLAVEGITSYTSAPLRMATVVGVVIALLALLYLVYVVIKAIVVGDPVAGYPTIIVSILFLGGLQLLFLGILGEYIGRIFTETKQRPVYFIREIDGEKVTE